MMTPLDCLLIGSLAVLAVAAVGLLAWAFVHQGRTRFSAERRGQGDEQ